MTHFLLPERRGSWCMDASTRPLLSFSISMYPLATFECLPSAGRKKPHLYFPTDSGPQDLSPPRVPGSPSPSLRAGPSEETERQSASQAARDPPPAGPAHALNTRRTDLTWRSSSLSFQGRRGEEAKGENKTEEKTTSSNSESSSARCLVLTPQERRPENLSSSGPERPRGSSEDKRGRGAESINRDSENPERLVFSS